MKNFLNVAIILTFVAFSSVSEAGSKEPTLTLKSDQKSLSFTRSQLLKRSDLQTIEIESDHSYGDQKMSYQAVPLAPLFESVGMKKDSTILFHCLDGFSAPLTSERLLNQDSKQAIAYLAIEPAKKPWPALKTGSKATAGPFYLVWINPKSSAIGNEEWPYQLSSFEVKPSLREMHPHVFPDSQLSAKDPINQGFQVFQKNCFSCHTMNGEGSAEMGPDLNIPMSATEYLSDSVLRTQIRDPQKVKHWANAKMHGFSVQALSDSDVDSLILYLKHMSKRKVELKTAN